MTTLDRLIFPAVARTHVAGFDDIVLPEGTGRSYDDIIKQAAFLRTRLDQIFTAAHVSDASLWNYRITVNDSATPPWIGFSYLMTSKGDASDRAIEQAFAKAGYTMRVTPYVFPCIYPAQTQ